MPLSLEKAKEKFGEAYVRAVAASARCKVGRYENDTDSDDLLIRRPGSFKNLWLQLKTTAVPVWRSGELLFDLSVKNYEDLRVSALNYEPGILVVTVVPTSTQRWLTHSHQSLIYRHCSYWLFLGGFPPTTNHTKERVRVPGTQVFDAMQLQGIMDRLDAGRMP